MKKRTVTGRVFKWKINSSRRVCRNKINKVLCKIWYSRHYRRIKPEYSTWLNRSSVCIYELIHSGNGDFQELTFCPFELLNF